MGLMEYPFVYLSNFATSVSLEDVDFLKARYKRNIVYIPNGVDDCIHFDLEKAGSNYSSLALNQEIILCLRLVG